MSGPAVIMATALVLAVGCSSGSTTSAARPAPSGSQSALPIATEAPVAGATTTSSPVQTKTVPLVCPPPDAPGPHGSDLVFSGVCGFHEQRLVPCPNNPQNSDDYYIRFTRPMRNGLTMYVDINVEHYRGPGTYDATTILIEIPNGTTIYEWSTNSGSLTVEADRQSGRLPRNELPPAIGTPTQGTEFLEGSFRCSPSRGG